MRTSTFDFLKATGLPMRVLGEDGAGKSRWLQLVIDQAREALRMCAPRARVLIAGGDGTVHQLLPVLIEREFELAFLPCGSGNDTVDITGLTSGHRIVFNSGGGWASAWPEWAYAIARDALLHGKLVRVIYQGAAPYGDNLVAVLLVV